MNFLTPWLAVWAAAIAIPALLILYFLRLRRKMEMVPSTLLWRKAVQDLQVNAPFQKLRRNLLLLLQLLVLAAAIFALARPIVESTLALEKSVIILIDRSGSMNAIEPEQEGQTRLELAKEQAKRLVRSLNRTGGRWFTLGADRELTRAMVIAIADRATIISPFTTNTSELPQLIDAITPTDSQTNLREGLDLAEAYMQMTRVEMRPNQGEAASRVVLISDGGISDGRDLLLRSGDMELLKIGATRDNVGITSMRVQRSYERPEQLSVFAQVQNFTPNPVATDLSLYVGESLGTMRLAGVQGLTLQPGQPAPEGEAGSDPNASGSGQQAGALSATFELTAEREVILELRLARDDALAADNRAWAVAPPARKLRALLVSAGNFFLESVLQGLPLQSVTYLTPQQYESAPLAEIAEDNVSRYDVVILDQHATERMPAGNYLVFGKPPVLPSIEVGEPLEGHAVMWWNETHPMLRHVALEHLAVARGASLKVPREAEIVAEGPRGPMIFRMVDAARQFVVVTFAVQDTTWWQQPGFPVFMYNTLRYLGAAGGGIDPGALQPGDTLRIALPAGQTETTVTLPSGRTERVAADASGVALFGGTSNVGLYQAEPALEARGRFAVNLASAAESDISPRGVTIGTQKLSEGQAIETSTPEVWRWFVGAAIVLLLLEWYIYNRRVML